MESRFAESFDKRWQISVDTHLSEVLGGGQSVLHSRPGDGKATNIVVHHPVGTTEEPGKRSLQHTSSRTPRSTADRYIGEVERTQPP